MRLNTSPQPLLTRGQLVQIRQKPQFDRLKENGGARQAVDLKLTRIIEDFYRTLPEGYRLHPEPATRHGAKMYWCTDPHGNDVAFPVTASEAFNDAWKHAVMKQPMLIRGSVLALNGSASRDRG